MNAVNHIYTWFTQEFLGNMANVHLSLSVVMYFVYSQAQKKTKGKDTLRKLTNK